MTKQSSELIENDRVVWIHDSDDTGVIKRVGPQVSEVKLDRGVTRYIPNRQLKKIKK